MYTNSNKTRLNKIMAKKSIENKETTVKISRWLVTEVSEFINSSSRNISEFPSKKNFVDKAVINMLESKGVKLDK